MAILLSLPLTLRAPGQTSPAAYLEQAAGKGTAPSQMTLQIDGKVYTKLEFIGTNGELVTFETNEGPITAKWPDLPKNIRDYFSQAYVDSLRSQQASVVTDLTATVEISGKVVQKLPQGVIVSWGNKLVLVTGLTNEAGVTNGANISIKAQRSGTFSYKTADGTDKTLQKFKATGS